MRASRVAAQLRNRPGVEVEKVRGGFGEFSVYIEGQKVIDTSRFWYPSTKSVVKRLEGLLAN